MKGVQFLVIFYSIISCKGDDDDIFSALADIQGLVKTQETIIESLEDYVKIQERKLEIINSYIDTMKIEQKLAENPTYLQNPINAFTMIKRLTHDLQYLETLILSDPEYYKNLVVRYPSFDDLKGASQGLVRIHRTYRLNVTELAKGMMKSKSNENREEKTYYFKSMSFDDCYVIGKALYDSKEYKLATHWLLEASDLFSSQRNSVAPYTIHDILIAVMSTFMKLDNCKAALKIYDKAFKGQDYFEMADDVTLMVHGCEMKVKQDEGKNAKEDVKENISEDPIKNSTKSHLYYEKFCRGEMDIAPAVKHRLKCRYLRTNHPFLLIAPMKLEELYLDPDVYLFHDVMSDGEIKKVKETSRLKFKRSKVRQGNQTEPSKSRISKIAWLNGMDCDVLDKLFIRVYDLSGYDLKHSPLFQIANYGVGGHYDVHFDYFSENKTGYDVFIKPGNRIATVMIYLTDVEEGGATTFTKLGLTMFPKKGAAVLWKNLHKNGEPDDRMCHGACPVLLGDKWGINLWIREFGQEFKEPCSLDPKQGMNSELLPPVPWTKSFGIMN